MDMLELLNKIEELYIVARKSQMTEEEYKLLTSKLEERFQEVEKKQEAQLLHAETVITKMRDRIEEAQKPKIVT